jgi:hypothetical protein
MGVLSANLRVFRPADETVFASNTGWGVASATQTRFHEAFLTSRAYPRTELTQTTPNVIFQR